MLVLFGAFTIWPMVSSWYYSLFEWDGFGPLSNFVGLDNYREVVASDQYWNAFKHSMYFAVVAIVIEVPLALVLAVLLNSSRLRGRNTYRLLLFLPVVTTTAVVGVVFTVLLNPLGGPINDAAQSLPGVDGPVNFLGSDSLALPTVMAVDIWKNIGITLIYWLAALQTIPADVLEAAKIDGANSMQTFRRITVPLLAPMTVIILILTFQRSLNPFDLVQTMTNGGPDGATDVAASYIFRTAFDPTFSAPRYGLASAAGVIFGTSVLVVTLAQAVVLRRMRGKSR